VAAADPGAPVAGMLSGVLPSLTTGEETRLSPATEAEINGKNNERQDSAGKPESQNVANPMPGDAGAGGIGGFHDRHFTLVWGIHLLILNVRTGPRRGWPRTGTRSAFRHRR
jgi:hypothetical protein